MKKLLLTLAIAALCQLCYAQKTKPDTLCDKLYSVKKINNKFYLLNMGGYYPDQISTVVLKGYQDMKLVFALKDSNICVVGKKSTYKGKLQLVVSGSLKGSLLH